MKLLANKKENVSREEIDTLDESINTWLTHYIADLFALPLEEVDPPCWIDAVKSNIGHLEGASGIVSFIKAVLVLQHAQILH